MPAGVWPSCFSPCTTVAQAGLDQDRVRRRRRLGCSFSPAQGSSSLLWSYGFDRTSHGRRSASRGFGAGTKQIEIVMPQSDRCA